jgi:hypothetical protein
MGSYIVFIGDVMAKKKVYGITSDARYVAKMTQLLSAKTGNVEQAIRIAEQANTSRAMGFAPYHADWNHIKMQLRIPPAISGIYRAFFNELIKQVKIRGVMTVELLIEKWQRMMGDAFDVNLAYEIARRAGVPVEREATPQTKA